MRFNVRKSFATIAATAAVIVATPATPALAINNENCGNRTDLVRITEDKHGDQCYANKGYRTFALTRTFWATRISSGNNDMRWLADGRWHNLSRWHVLTFPNAHSVKLSAIEIL
jgi:hypothetical protein